jgi:hypothetical protein
LKSTGLVVDLPENALQFSFTDKKDLLVIGCSDNSVEFLQVFGGIYAEKPFYSGISGLSAIAVSPDGKNIVLGDIFGIVKIYRNPLLVKNYNLMLQKGDEAMDAEKYTLAVSAYKTALSIYPEKEAEEKLKIAQQKMQQKREEQFKKLQQMKEKLKKK